MKQIEIRVSKEGMLTVHASPMSLPELYTFLALACKNVLESGKVDGQIELPTPEQQGILLNGAN